MIELHYTSLHYTTTHWVLGDISKIPYSHISFVTASYKWKLTVTHTLYIAARSFAGSRVLKQCPEVNEAERSVTAVNDGVTD